MNESPIYTHIVVTTYSYAVDPFADGNAPQDAYGIYRKTAADPGYKSHLNGFNDADEAHAVAAFLDRRSRGDA